MKPVFRASTNVASASSEAFSTLFCGSKPILSSHNQSAVWVEPRFLHSICVSWIFRLIWLNGTFNNGVFTIWNSNFEYYFQINDEIPIIKCRFQIVSMWQLSVANWLVVRMGKQRKVWFTYEMALCVERLGMYWWSFQNEWRRKTVCFSIQHALFVNSLKDSA